MSAWDKFGGGDDNITRLPLPLRRVRTLDPAQIPPREWLYSTLLLKRHVTMLVAPGGTGKSQLALATAIDLATGRGLLGYHIFQRVPTWILSLEDDADELDRRIAAFRLVHNIGWDELDGWLHVHGDRARPVCMAKLDPEHGSIVFPDHDEIVASARAGSIGAIWVDPFIRSHELDENNNPHMDAAVAAWMRVAEEVGCAVSLVHHVRKGPAAGIETARGAKALTDAARVGLLLTAMTTEEAEEIGIAEEDAYPLRPARQRQGQHGSGRGRHMVRDGRDTARQRDLALPGRRYRLRPDPLEQAQRLRRADARHIGPDFCRAGRRAG